MTEPKIDTSDRLVDDQLKHVRLLEILSSIPEFEAQVEKFAQIMAPDQYIQVKYDWIEQDLASVLSKVFVQPFMIRPVGSRVPGIQLYSSDMDMNIYFEKRPNKARTCIKMLAEALLECELFHSVENLSQARIPIVKCVHVRTGLKCDINFSYLCGVENSQLIKNYISIDSKLRLAMLVIKYWAEIHDLTGVQRGFSKYSLAMMFIFYLQHYHSFPSVYELQGRTVPTNPNTTWNMNFSHIQKTPEIREIESKSTLTLLLGFFSYYTDFEYASTVICPYFGSPMFKIIFEDPNFLQVRFHRHANQLKQFKQFMDKRYICLQDPLELNRNVLSAVDELNLSRFIKQCSIARKCLRKRRSYMLIELFSPLEDLNGYFQVNLYMTTCSVEKIRAKNTFESNPELMDFWFKRTLNFCTSVFQRILGLKIESEGHYDKHHSYTVSSRSRLWLDQDVDMKITEEQLEQWRIDSEIEDESKNSSARTESVDCDGSELKYTIMITRNEKLPCVEVEFFRRASDEDLFASFAIHTSRNLVKWFHKLDNYMPNIPTYLE